MNDGLSEAVLFLRLISSTAAPIPPAVVVRCTTPENGSVATPPLNHDLLSLFAGPELSPENPQVTILGIRRVIIEVVKKPSPCRESGVELLLCNIMKGYSSSFHSKAERVIQLLASETLYPISDEADQGIGVYTAIVKAVGALYGPVHGGANEVSFGGGLGSLVVDKIGHNFSQEYHNRAIFYFLTK